MIEKLMPIPSAAPDKRYSALFCTVNQPGKPTDWLIQQSLRFIADAVSVNLSEISARIKSGENYIDIFPGEHYRLLASVIKNTQPKIVVELGTHLGYSALCMKKFMPPEGCIHTFDVIPWNGFADTILAEKDFDNNLKQHTDDLTKWEDVVKHKEMLENADVIFMDALKDGKQEYLFLEHFSKLNFRKKCLFVFDDIRLWNMLDIWYHMNRPKMDLTSFGHWSGTGLVEWN